MTDLTRGIIEIEGMTLSRNTKAVDFENISNPNIQVTVSKRGHTYVKFKNPIVAGNISVFVNVACYTDSPIPEFELRPAVPDELRGDPVEISKYKVSASKQWLKKMINGNPTTDCDTGTSYHFSDIHITSFAQEDIHYGLRGGEIKIRFGE